MFNGPFRIRLTIMARGPKNRLMRKDHPGRPPSESEEEANAAVKIVRIAALAQACGLRPPECAR